ncbi:hypothetical protein [Propionispora vibrioides]|uniref:YqzN/YkzM domain-containing protein n=1 Tax=Propionispora vibrioides TaxID=112903 RepID=A0A1H8U6P5_9FIRM|nr:hypothetical protein [Propionispora vibrioides]SEO98514.1 hypothetical protein SAMN04490178_10841 [Propionispora vibrioides]
MASKETASKTTPEQEYAMAELKANAPLLFGVQPEVIDGALYNNRKQTFSVSEMKKLIDTFLEKKVK